MTPWIQSIITIICAVFASSGFWALLQRKSEKSDAEKDMLMGLAHDRIFDLGMRYIERGYITQAEYDNLSKYLYKPYRLMGGNGSAEHMMEEVDKLPWHPHSYENDNKEQV